MNPICWGRCAVRSNRFAISSALPAGSSQASGNARDLVALKNSLQQIPELKRELGKLIERINFGRASSL